MKALSSQTNYTIDFIATREQLQELWELDADAYDECSIGFEIFQSWWMAYPRGLTTVCSEKKLVGAMGIWPISPEQYQEFVSGRIREEELIPVSEAVCSIQPQSHWYFSGSVIKPEIRRLKSRPIKLLLEAAVGYWCSSGHIAYPVFSCALGYSLEGRRMLNRCKFRLTHAASIMPDNCPLYQFSANSQQEIINQILRQ